MTPHLASRLPAAPGNDLPAKFLLFSDPPSHSRLRRAVSGWLTPRAVESSRRRIAAIAGTALACHHDGEPLDVMDDLAYPVPLAVICELLDAPAGLAIRLRDETPHVAALLDPLADTADLQVGAVAAFSLLVNLSPWSPGAEIIQAQTCCQRWQQAPAARVAWVRTGPS